ncbi:MAG: Ig-like domain-containing protein [Candidatus Staskawiczbacteria bacterium]|nr:Ig-like domain-containing protein [Candidatus Staskawiczbacteria bacterium]
MNIFDKKISALVVLGLALFLSSVASSPVQALNLDDASVTPGILYGGRSTTYDVSFFVGSSTDPGARIHIIFPSGYGLDPAGSSLSTSGITVSSATVATATVSAEGGSTADSIFLWLTAADGTIALASTTIHISGIPAVNPYAGGVQTIGVETRTAANDASDSASTTAANSITIIPAPEQASNKQTTIRTSGPPVSQITSPTAGQVISAGQDYMIKGTASDLGVYAVSKVEVSVNGGSTWNTATLTKVSESNFAWDYTWIAPTQGSYTIKSRATDTDGNVESPGTGVSVTVSTSAPATTSNMTDAEKQTKIQELKQLLTSLMQQLIQLLTQQLQGLIQ